MRELDSTTSGLMSGRDIIGEVTEAVKKYVKDGWTDERNLTIEEQLDKTSMGKADQFAFVYMYRLAHNPNLQNRKRFRRAPVFLNDGEDTSNVYLHRPPIMVDLFYLITAHAQFPSETAKLNHLQEIAFELSASPFAHKPLSLMHFCLVGLPASLGSL